MAWLTEVFFVLSCFLLELSSFAFFRNGDTNGMFDHFVVLPTVPVVKMRYRNITYPSSEKSMLNGICSSSVEKQKIAI